MRKKRFTLPCAVHLFLLRRNLVLLQRRFNTGYEDGKYGVISGHLEGSEEVKAAAIREAREEAGIEIAPWDLEIVGVMHRRSNDERIDFFLAATTWSGEIVNREPHRCDRLAWFEQDNLPDNTIPYVRRAFENYRRGVWFDGFGWSPETAQASPTFQVRPISAGDSGWIARFVRERWGAEEVIAHGTIYRPGMLPGFVAVQAGERVGLVTHHISGDDCEIVTIDSIRPGIGIGSALLESVKEAAREAGCRRVFLITTNDNLHALRFYQRRGFRLVAIHRDALAEARRIKPTIPLVGASGIPLRDEIELEIRLDSRSVLL